MNKSFTKFVTDIGPLVVFFYFYYTSDKNLKIAIVGDILHSRVAMSNIFGLQKMGANVLLCAPPHLLPKYISEFGARHESSVDQKQESESQQTLSNKCDGANQEYE